MNSTYCIKGAKGVCAKIDVYGTYATNYYCCGVLDYGSASVSEIRDSAFFKVPDDLRRTATSRREVYDKISADMVRDFGAFRTVFMTDKVDGNNHRLMKLFKHKDWKKKITYSELPNQNTKRMLVTCLLIKKAPKNVK